VSYRPYRNEETRSSILAALSSPGDEAAWGRFFDAYAGYVFAIARNGGLSEADADEIVQRVMGELVSGPALSRYDRARSPFHLWLARLVRWRVANFRRGAAARAAAEARYAREAEADGTPDADPFAEEWRGAVLEEALRRLRAESNPAHYAAYHASVVERLDTAAVVRLCGVSRDNLYQIRRRLGARFRVLLAETARDLDAGGPVPPAGG